MPPNCWATTAVATNTFSPFRWSNRVWTLSPGAFVCNRSAIARNSEKTIDFDLLWFVSPARVGGEREGEITHRIAMTFQRARPDQVVTVCTGGGVSCRRFKTDMRLKIMAHELADVKRAKVCKGGFIFKIYRAWAAFRMIQRFKAIIYNTAIVARLP